MYQDLKDNKMIHIINNIGPRKNAADFALTVQVFILLSLVLLISINKNLIVL